MTHFLMPTKEQSPMLFNHRYHDLEIGRMAEVAAELDAYMALTYLAAAYANNMLGQLTGTGLFLSLHTASPANTGANEIVGGTGYTGTRPPIAWAAASAGVVASSGTGAPQTFALLVTQAGGIPYWGLWTAATAGIYICGGTTTGLTGSIPSGAQVQFATGAVVLTVSG